PVAGKISDPAGKEEHDHPASTVTRDGTRWIVWQAYQDSGDHVYARHSTPNGWSSPFRLTDTKTDVYRTAVAEDSKNRVWVVWAERDSGQSDVWNLYGRAFSSGAWSARQRLSEGRSPNFSHQLVSAGDGVVHLIWIAHEDGQSFVYHRKLAGADWS